MSNWPYPRIVAHRGGGKLAPENTLAAIDVGARYGHTMIEFDAKLSKDGQIFLLHDDNLERTSNGWGVAGELAWDDLLKVDAGSWFSREFKGEPLPLLSQVAERCRRHGMMANIEIKPTTGLGPQTGKVVALAARDLWQGMTAPLLSSFEIDALGRTLLISLQLVLQMLLLRAGLIVQILLQHALLLLLLHLHLILHALLAGDHVTRLVRVVINIDRLG